MPPAPGAWLKVGQVLPSLVAVAMLSKHSACADSECQVRRLAVRSRTAGVGLEEPEEGTPPLLFGFRN